MDRPERILRERATLELKGGGRSRLWNDVKAGTFPAPVRIGARAVGWFEDEILAWQQRLRAERDARRRA
jgi:prophage regulatory protein